MKKIKQKIGKILLIFVSMVMVVMSLHFSTNNNVSAAPIIQKNYKPYWHVMDGGDNGFEIRIDGKQGYCVQPYEHLDEYATYQTGSNAIVDLTEEQARMVQLISYYGYHYPGREDPGYEQVTQAAIWQYLGAYKWVNSSLASQSYMYTESQIISLIAQIMADVNNFFVTPSFSNTTISLKAGETYTFTDTNNVLADYNIVSTGGLEIISKSGNTLVVKATKDSDDSARIIFERDMSKNPYAQNTPMYLYNPGSQNLMVASHGDPMEAYVNVDVSKSGFLELTKTNTGVDLVDGAVFNISGEGYNQNHTVTDGKITLELPMGDYQIQEVSAPIGYLINKEIYTVTISSNETSKKTVKNEEPVASVTLYKQDNETGQTPQGDAKLDGAVYGIFAAKDNYNDAGTVKFNSKDQLIGQGSTVGRQIKFTNIPLGEYYIREIAPSSGYLLDTTTYNVSLTYENQDTAVTTKNLTVYEQVIRRPGQFTKITTNGATGLTDVEANAEFEIILKSSGAVYDTVVTDENGIAITKMLPYGTYIVHQTKGIEEAYFCPDFEIVINENSNDPQQYVINNQPFGGYLEVFKNDANSLKLITASSATFKILNVDTGEYVSQKVGSEYLDTFTTNDKGQCTTYLQLNPGNYRLIEIASPNGYLIDSKGIDFKISNTMPYRIDDDGDAWFTLNYKNKAVMGEIIVSKTGETTSGGTIALPGTEFECYALDNILAPWDNVTVLKEAGTLIDTQVTDSTGTAKFTNLYPGNYYVVESSALPNYIPDATKYNVTLTYKDNQTAIVTGSLSLTNKLTETEVSKTDITGEAEIPGAYLKVVNSNGDTAWEGITTGDKTIIKGLERGQTYTLVEEAAPNGYVIASSVKFSINMDGTVTKVRMIDKQIGVFKMDITDENTLKDAKLTVIDDEGVVVDSWISTDEIHYVSGLEEGKTYTLVEETAPNGYVIANDVKFTVSYIKKTEFVKMVDKQVEVSKTDIITAEELPGSNLAITDIEGNIIDEWVSTTEPHFVSGLKEGETYILIEVSAPYGYEIAEPIEFTVTNAKETQKITMKDEPILSGIKIRKVDSLDETKVLKQAEFTLYDMDMEVLKVLETDDEGLANFEDLRCATYYLKETKAPIGYKLSDEVIEIIIDENYDENHVYEITVLNTLMPSMVQTGDTTNTTEYLFIAIAALSFLSLLYFKKSRNKKKI